MARPRLVPGRSAAQPPRRLPRSGRPRWHHHGRHLPRRPLGPVAVSRRHQPSADRRQSRVDRAPPGLPPLRRPRPAGPSERPAADRRPGGRFPSGGRRDRHRARTQSASPCSASPCSASRRSVPLPRLSGLAVSQQSVSQQSVSQQSVSQQSVSRRWGAGSGRAGPTAQRPHASPVRGSLPRRSPVRGGPPHASPVRGGLLRRSPVRGGLPRRRRAHRLLAARLLAARSPAARRGQPRRVSQPVCHWAADGRARHRAARPVRTGPSQDPPRPGSPVSGRASR